LKKNSRRENQKKENTKATRPDQLASQAGIQNKKNVILFFCMGQVFVKKLLTLLS